VSDCARRNHDSQRSPESHTGDGSLPRTAAPERRAALFAAPAGQIASDTLAARTAATYAMDEITMDKIRPAVAAAASGERDGKRLLLPNG